MADVGLLKNIYLFKDLSSSELEQIASIAKEKNFSAGQDIFIAGQPADCFYVIRMGTVKIYATTSKGDDIQISNISTGSHFGEMPLLDNEKRSATAQSVEATSALEISFKDLRNILEKNPVIGNKVYFAVARFLCNRLRATTEDLNHARELRLKHF